MDFRKGILAAVALAILGVPACSDGGKPISSSPAFSEATSNDERGYDTESIMAPPCSQRVVEVRGTKYKFIFGDGEDDACELPKGKIVNVKVRSLKYRRGGDNRRVLAFLRAYDGYGISRQIASKTPSSRADIADELSRMSPPRFVTPTPRPTPTTRQRTSTAPTTAPRTRTSTGTGNQPAKTRRKR